VGIHLNSIKKMTVHDLYKNTLVNLVWASHQKLTKFFVSLRRQIVIFDAQVTNARHNQMEEI